MLAMHDAFLCRLDGVPLREPCAVEELCLAVRCNTSLAHLSLQNTGVTGPGLSMLQGALERQAALRSLDLTGNAISPEETLELASSLPPHIKVCVCVWVCVCVCVCVCV